MCGVFGLSCHGELRTASNKAYDTAMTPTQMSEARYEHDSGMIACRGSKLRSSWLSGSAEGHIGFAVGVICCKWPPTKPHRQSHDLRSEMQRLLSHGALRLRDQ